MTEINWGFVPDKKLIEQSDKYMFNRKFKSGDFGEDDYPNEWNNILKSYMENHKNQNIFRLIKGLPFKNTAGQFWFAYKGEFINNDKKIITDNGYELKIFINHPVMVKNIISDYKSTKFMDFMKEMTRNTIGFIESDGYKDLQKICEGYIKDNREAIFNQYQIYIMNNTILKSPKLNKQIVLYRTETVRASEARIEYVNREYTKLNNIIPVAHFKSYSYRYSKEQVKDYFCTKIILPPNFPFLSYGDPYSSTTEYGECILPYTLDPTGKTLNYGFKIIDIDNDFKGLGGYMVTVIPVLLDKSIIFRNFLMDRLLITKKTIYKGWTGVFNTLNDFSEQTFNNFKLSTDPEHQHALKLYYMWKKLMDIKKNEIVTNNDSLLHITTNLIKLLENL
jgi:hypothetical protein